MIRFLTGTLLVSALAIFALGCENRDREGTMDTGTGTETETTPQQREMDRTTPPDNTGVTPRDTDTGTGVTPRDTDTGTGVTPRDSDTGTNTGTGQTGTEDANTGTGVDNRNE